MTPEGDKRKYDVTLVETIVHTFTVELPDTVKEEDRHEAAEHAFLDDKIDFHGQSIIEREVENVTPQG
ncbi:hypothetical protein [Aquibium oceanicum]|uniref:Uncharacterized protein n=1 Tax=Aquibium oceanicum TaxID=1670800 RepID=A0A1L3SXH1_9HYPH|nr:hypothetical protein [Aquibium oceanicum]APH74126.1 hypothetical protein BSQ44_24215 [Aquibium oceanicum]